MEDIKVLKGNIVFSTSVEEIKTYTESYIVLRDGVVESIYQQLPEKYQKIQVSDFGSKIIIPGFVDLHIHASQFYQRGLGMDLELIEWLDRYTFQQEKQFSDIEYAKKVYNHFADELIRQGTLNACIYATTHKPATELLFEVLSQRGIYAFVGKVNMDRNCPEGLREDTHTSLKETEELILKYQKSTQVRPILTPRFVPTCTKALLEGVGKLAQKYNIPVQSHLSENRDEVKWIKELYSDSVSYSSIYDECGLFGQTPTLMAHCIYTQEDEIERMAENEVVAVHCPDSNSNLASGIMPVRKFLRKGVVVGLGSDVGGGHNISMTTVVVHAIQQSKLKKVTHPELEPLTIEEAFYMATKGGGSFFGKVGSFEAGYRFDAIVIDDTGLGADNLPLKERLQRFIYIGDDRNITERFVNGCKLGQV